MPRRRRARHRRRRPRRGQGGDRRGARRARSAALDGGGELPDGRREGAGRFRQFRDRTAYRDPGRGGLRAHRRSEAHRRRGDPAAPSPAAPSCSSPPSATPPPVRSSTCGPGRVATAIAAEMRAAKLVFLCDRPGVLDPRGALVRELTFEEAKALAADLRRAGDGRDDDLGSPARAVDPRLPQRGQPGPRHRPADRRRPAAGAVLPRRHRHHDQRRRLRFDPARDHRRRGRHPGADPPRWRNPAPWCAAPARSWRRRSPTSASSSATARWSRAPRCTPTRRTGSPSSPASPWTARTAAGSTANGCSISSNARPGAAGAERLFVLTTQASHWFRERGFVEAGHSALPRERRDLYNFQRRSRILVRAL